MDQFRGLVTGIYDKVLVTIGVLLVLLPISPLNVIQPGRDSGVFLYIGWRILHGEIPYLQMWDHKPPMIFLINALGLAIGRGSIWGVWFLELILLISAAFIGYRLVKRFFGSLPAIFSLSLWLMSLVFVIKGGNLTTEYTLIIQFALLWLAVEAEEKGYFAWRGYLIGFLSGVAFFTKQNVISIGLSIVIYLVISRLVTRQYRALIRALAVILLGSLTVVVILLVFLLRSGSLGDFWDAAFVYNFVYVENLDLNPFGARLDGIRIINKSGLVHFALVGWAAGIILLLFKKEIESLKKAALTITIMVLPFEFLLVDLSGRGYKHYFMTLLPILSIFAAMAFWLILSSISIMTVRKRAGVYFTVLIIILLLFSLADEYYRAAKNYRIEGDRLIADYIQKATAKDDTVLLWGNEVGYNFSGQRVAPSRYIYQVPFYVEGYTDRQKVEEFLSEVIENKPMLLIDTGNPNAPLYEFNVSSPKIDQAIDYLRAHYQPEETIRKWIIYQFVESPGT